MPLTRSVVVGTTGSGKTTFARRLANAVEAPYIELDALYWKPNWQACVPDEFEEKVSNVVAGERWVVDGNYSSVRPIVWKRATAIVWLNYPFALTYFRLLRRSVRRLITGEELFSGNRESFSSLFLSRDSLLLWAITSQPKYRRDYPEALKQFPNVELYEFHRPSEADAYIAQLERSGP
jgi:adenylate kinase family enzyme